jgi:glycosyltransferase involved in cell wall biosynthesis
LPTVLIEGALLGRPLVATDVGGVREIIADGRTGLVVPPGDAEVLATAMLRILGGEGPAFGAAARADALQRFTFDRFGDDIAALYRSLLRQPATLAA